MIRRSLLLTLLFHLLACCGAAFAQEAPAPQRAPFGEGTHALRRIFYDRGFRPVANIQELKDPARSVLVVLGDTQPLEIVHRSLLRGGLRRWIEQGGALVVASDRRSSPILESTLGVSISGEIVLPSLPLVPPYRGLKECPFVTPQVDATPALFLGPPVPPPLASPLVAANLPSRLEYGPDKPRSLVLLAVLIAPDPTRPSLLKGRYQSAIFALGGPLGQGHALVLADHSVFINDMLLQPDNGNIDFAYRMVEWLQGSEPHRNRILYYEDGVVRQDFDIPLKQVVPPIPPPEAILPLVNQTLHGLEEENTFNRLLFDNLGQERIWSGLAIALCALLAVYGFVRLGLFRHRQDLAKPGLPHLLRRNAPQGSLVDQRIEALLREDNLWETARTLARHAFETAGVRPQTGHALPTLEVRGNAWRRWRWTKRIYRLWNIAYGTRPVRVSRGRLANVKAEASLLATAMADGTVRFPS